MDQTFRDGRHGFLSFVILERFHDLELTLGRGQFHQGFGGRWRQGRQHVVGVVLGFGFFLLFFRFAWFRSSLACRGRCGGCGRRQESPPTQMDDLAHFLGQQSFQSGCDTGRIGGIKLSNQQSVMFIHLLGIFPLFTHDIDSHTEPSSGFLGSSSGSGRGRTTGTRIHVCW